MGIRLEHISQRVLYLAGRRLKKYKDREDETPHTPRHTRFDFSFERWKYYNANKLCAYTAYTLQRVGGAPSHKWDDMFGQYGIKVSFGGSGTLKIVILVENLNENHPQKRIFRLDYDHPSEVRGC
jgi:hypothetical protein